MEIRVYYEDTDAGGVVYYANYLRYLERARTEYLRERGMDVGEYLRRNILFVVSTVEIRYLAPAYYNDLLGIDLEVTDLSKASLTFSHRIRRRGQEDPISDGKVTLVCVGSDFKPRPLPPEIRTLFIRAV